MTRDASHSRSKPDTFTLVPYDTEAYRNPIRSDQAWNFWVNVGDLSFVNLAGSFAFISTILPLYASYLTDSRVLIGLIPAVFLMASHGPQLFMTAHAEALGLKKPWVVRASVFERVPWLILGLGIVSWPEAPAWFSYAFLVAMLLAAEGAVGIASPAWRAMLGNVIHPDRKGLMFGLGSTFGALMGALGTLLVRHILNTVAFSRSFGFCFLLAFAGQALSWTFLTLNREPERPPDRPRSPLASYLRELPRVLREDANFSRFLISQALVTLGTLGVAFYIVYGREAFGISDAFAATLTMVALISKAIGTPLLGWWRDRFGHQSAAEVSALLCAAAGVVMAIAPSHGWMFAAFVLLTVSDFGLKVARPSLAMDLGAGSRVPACVALTTTLLTLPSLATPILGGWLIDLVGFRPVFVAGATLSVIGWVLMRASVADPRINRRSTAC